MGQVSSFIFPAIDEILANLIHDVHYSTGPDKILYELDADDNLRQFREIPGLLEGRAKPDMARCIDISTRAALAGSFKKDEPRRSRGEKRCIMQRLWENASFPIYLAHRPPVGSPS